MRRIRIRPGAAPALVVNLPSGVEITKINVSRDGTKNIVECLFREDGILQLLIFAEETSENWVGIGPAVRARVHATLNDYLKERGKLKQATVVNLSELHEAIGRSNAVATLPESGSVVQRLSIGPDGDLVHRRIRLSALYFVNKIELAEDLRAMTLLVIVRMTCVSRVKNGERRDMELRYHNDEIRSRLGVDIRDLRGSVLATRDWIVEDLREMNPSFEFKVSEKTEVKWHSL